MADDDDAPDGQLKSPTDPDESATTAPERAAVGNEASPSDDRADGQATDEAVEVNDEAPDANREEPLPGARLAMAFGVLAVLILGGLAGVGGFHAYQSYQSEQQAKLFLQVARQGALNLTTIDHADVDADIQRILDSATGTFYDDFQQRAPTFVEVVKQARSKTAGTITEAGLESVAGDSAQALVAVSVETSNAGADDQQPRNWRMRIAVQKIGDELKVSNVGFVP
jgi:Mce-associated membrane protein